MDDKTFIDNFLNKNFTVNIEIDKPVIIENYTKKQLREIDFHTLVAKILGTYLTPEGIVSRKLVCNWLDERINKLELSIETYLYKCDVKLTNDGWIVVNEKDEEVTIDFLCNLLEGKQTYEDIYSYYNKWFYEKIHIAVDKLMRQY